MTGGSAAAIGACIPILVLAAGARAAMGSWLVPGAFFALYWTAAMLIPVALGPPDLIGFGGLMWITGIAGVFVVGTALVRSRPGEARGEPHDPRFVREVRRATLLLSIAGIGVPLVALVSAGYGLSVLTSGTALASAAAALSIGRYTETYSPPFLSQALLPFMCAAPLFGGLLASIGDREWKRGVLVLPFMGPLLMTITQTQRAVTVMAITLFLAAYLSGRVATGRTGLFTRAHVLIGTLGIAGLLVLGLAAGMLRIGANTASEVAFVMTKVLGGLFGHIPVFTQWFDTAGLTDARPTLGAISLAGPFDALGLQVRRPGLFAESVVLTSGDETNLYTAFRGLIEDFTPVGAVAVCLVLAVVCAMAFDRVRARRLLALPVLAGFYTTVVYSPIASIWIYNSIVAAFVLFAAGLWFARWRAAAARRTDPAGVP